MNIIWKYENMVSTQMQLKYNTKTQPTRSIHLLHFYAIFRKLISNKSIPFS